MDFIQARADLEWGQELRCISLNTGASLMHKLRYISQISFKFLFICMVIFSFRFSSLPFEFLLSDWTITSDFRYEVRPQPSWDRTCTAAAAISLLDELQLVPQFGSFGLDKQAEAIENALEVLLEALIARRLRMGRSISRKERHNRDIC